MFTKITLTTLIFTIASSFCYAAGPSSAELLKTALEEYAAGKDARIGIGIITDTGDTISINGSEKFPMMSVYKFPIALAFGDYCRKNDFTINDSCLVATANLQKDTFSPMLKFYSDVDSARITFKELLAYALQQSDNNASDILLDISGDAPEVNRFIRQNGFEDINIVWSEKEMHENPERSYENYSTPTAMESLLTRFDKEFNDTISREIKYMMESCATGTDRLAAAISGDITIGHKTGTGFALPDGRLMAINDCGYIHVPGGGRYTIAVFIADSGYDMDTSSRIIAEISRIVLEHFQSRLKSA